MIEDGSETVGNAGQIVDADGDASSATISAEAEGDGHDDQGPFPDPVGCARFSMSLEQTGMRVFAHGGGAA